MNTPPPIVPQTPPPVILPLPPSNSFARQAALFSVLAPFVCIADVLANQAFHDNRAAMIIGGITNTLLILAAFGLGITALIATKKHGRKGIFGRAIIGILINGIIILFMLIYIPRFIRATQKAKERHRLQMEQHQ